jgi:PAS domain S-box-containing protein
VIFEKIFLIYTIAFKLDIMRTEIEIPFPDPDYEIEFYAKDIFDVDEIQRMQDLFSGATGVASIITRPDGTPITRPRNFCRLCNDIIRKTEKGCLNCVKSDTLIGKHNLVGATVQPCLSGGLLEAGASITIKDIHVANWLIGQVRNEDFDEQRMIEYADEIGANKEEFLKALREVPVMSVERFKKIADMLFVYANDLSDRIYKNIQLKQQIAEHEQTNELLLKSEETLSITLNSIGDGVVSTDRNGLIRDMNPVAEQLCGWKLSEAKAQQLTQVFNVVNCYTRMPVDNPVERVLESGNVIELTNHAVLISKNGTECYIADSAAPIKNREGEIIGVVLVFSDISEKHIAEERLRESERSKSVLLSNIPGMAYRCKPDLMWSMEFISEGFVNLTGYEISDILYKNVITFNDLILPQYRDYLWKAWGKAIKNKEFVREEYQILTANNQIKWVWEQGVPIYNKDGEVEALEGIIIDITERKKTEEALRESEHYLKESQIIAQLGTYTLDIVNDKWVSSGIFDSLFGIDNHYDKTIEGWLKMIHPDLQESIYEYFTEEVVAKKNRFDKEYKIIRVNDSEERWVHGLGELVLDELNQPIKMIGIIQDITDRKLASEALRKNEQKYRSMFENVQDVFYQLDMSGTIIEISPSIISCFDYNPKDVIGKPAASLYAKAESRDRMLAELMRYGEIKDYEIELVTKTGAVKNISNNSRLIFDSKGNPSHIDGSLRDITFRKMTEEALRASEKKFHDYIEFAPHGVFVASESGRYIEVNSAASKITGYSREELITMSQTDLISSESFESFENHFKTVASEGFAKDEFELIRKDKSKGYIKVDTVKLSECLYLGFVVDISFHKNAEEKLKRSETFLKETQTIAMIGNCSIDVVSGVWTSSEILDNILGIDYNFPKSLDALLNIAHPDWIEKLFIHYKVEVVQNQNKFDKKFKIIRQSDKTERWVHAIGEMKYNSNNEPIEVIGIVQDITERKNAAIALKQSEELYRSVLNASPDAITIVEMDGEISMVSPAAMLLYGCEGEDQIIGLNMFDFVSPLDRERAIKNANLMFDGYMGTIGYRIQKAGGGTFFAEVNGDIIWDQNGQPSKMIFIIRDITSRKLAESALKSSQEQLKKFASHLQNVREEEKILLAREIHDELGQILIAIKIDLGMMKQKVLKVAKTTELENILTAFDNLFGLVDNTIKTTKKIMTDLRPEVLYLLGFIEAVKLHVNQFQERHQINCYFESSVTNLELNTQQSVALFRILQESLTNVAKHAKATSVKILFFNEDDKLILEISDNGIGIDDNYKIKHDSYGLIGMKERVFLLDGELLISKRQGNGTMIKVLIPYKRTNSK